MGLLQFSGVDGETEPQTYILSSYVFSYLGAF